MATLADVEAIVAGLPEVTAYVSFDTRAFRVRRSFICRILAPELIMVHIGIERREVLLRHEPRAFSIKSPHYDNTPAMLVHLPQVSLNNLEDLLVDPWFEVAPKRLAASYAATLATDSAASSSGSLLPDDRRMPLA